MRNRWRCMGDTPSSQSVTNC